MTTPVFTSLETPTAQSWYNPSNNRYTTASGWTYDGAGNVLQVGGMNRSFTYDAENRQITATINSQPTAYTYDGDGRRVGKAVCPVGTQTSSCSSSTSGATVTIFVYDAAGNLTSEYGPSTDVGTKYLTADHLGSTRLETDSTGAVTKCYDYMPFAQELGNGVDGRGSCFGNSGSSYPTTPDVLSTKFTSKERDAESGLDYFGARYMSSAQGRFTSPDPEGIGSSIRDPQSWNMYV